MPLPVNASALCTRCGARLYRHIPNSLNRALALNITAFMLFILANVYPFVSLKLSGRIEENLMISGTLAMFREGMFDLGILVFCTSILFPGLTILGMLYMLVPLKFGKRPRHLAAVYRIVKAIAPWSLTGVFMLGVLIAIVKLLDLATILPGISLMSFAVLLFVVAAASSNLDPAIFWPHATTTKEVVPAGATAAGLDLTSCHTCALLLPQQSAHDASCPRCTSPLHEYRKRNSITRTWALLCAAAVLLIPANVYPVMTVIRFGQGEPNTILSGVVHLIESGMWGLAFIVFFASIVVPSVKLVVLSFLLVSIQRSSSWRPVDRTRLYRFTEIVGAWSMVDIFLVALLSSLVNLDALATIRPEIGASFFAGVVVITMFAAHSFDPRLIWDNAGNSS